LDVFIARRHAIWLASCGKRPYPTRLAAPAPRGNGDSRCLEALSVRATIVPSPRDTAMAQATLKNQQKILSGHRNIISNQKKILRNQERLLLVLANEVIIIRNQEAIIKNQKKILANQAKLGAR
jgi:hypothetical protein